MQSLDINKDVWRDKAIFDAFLESVVLLRRNVSKEAIDAAELLKIANIMDDIMKMYEERHGPIEDPLFYWWFATANAFFLQIGKRLDEVGTARIGYIVNGYKEALNRHLLYPTLDGDMLIICYDNIGQFANSHDKEWIERNKEKFKPVA